jgi:hypothetical protein
MDSKAIILDAVIDKQGDIWGGGQINHRAYLPGADMADAYLGRFSKEGKQLAEFTFGGWSWRQIVSLYPQHAGGVLVTGPIGRSSSKSSGTWLASITERGKTRWEKTIGLPAASAVAEGRDGNIAFVGVRKADSPNQTYQEDAVFWLFDPEGRVLAEHVIRPAINDAGSRRYESVALEEAPDGYFALVRWGDPSDDKPLTVVKVSQAGTVQWSASLKHTATPWQGRSKVWNKCHQGQAVLANGDLLVTCSVEGEIVLSRLDGKSGVERTQKAALPGCHEKRPAVITPIPIQENSVLLFGTRPGNNVAASCTWLAEWALE